MNKDTIQKIILEQKDEIKLILKKSFVKRDKEKILLNSLKDDLIKVVIGVRRSGKSSLVHRVLKDQKYGYLNFDDERLQKIQADDLDEVLQNIYEINGKTKYLFFDEIQNVDGWELFVSRLRRQGHTVFVTGSNSKLLSKELATHLTGRHFSMELFPFSFSEFLAWHKIKTNKNNLITTQKRAELYKMLKKYILSSGFPETLQISDPQSYLRDLYTKIILQDIVGRYHIKHSGTLKNIAGYLLGNFATRQSYNKLKNIFNIKSEHTVKNYLDYLEEAYLIFSLLGFSPKQKESLRGPKKIYSVDHGLIQAIEPGISENYGRLMENIIFTELKRKNKNIFYYNDYAGWEVDFLIKDGFKITELIQVTQNLNQENTKKRELRSLIKASDKFNCNNLTIITYEGRKKTENIKNKTIKIIPLLDWLLKQKL